MKNIQNPIIDWSEKPCPQLNTGDISVYLDNQINRWELGNTSINDDKKELIKKDFFESMDYLLIVDDSEAYDLFQIYIPYIEIRDNEL